jgi:hypothetical protein
MKFKTIVGLIVSVCLLAAGTTLNSQSGAGNFYQDPQGRFAVRLANGWTASALDQNTVQFAGDGAFAVVFLLRGGDTAEEFISLLAGQYARQWQNFKQLKGGQATLGGLPGMAAAYSGTNPNGALSSLRIVAAMRPDRGYGLVISVPQDRIRAAMPALDLLESSFTIPGGQAQQGAPGWGTPQQSPGAIPQQPGAMQYPGAMPQAQPGYGAQAPSGMPRGGIPLQVKQAGYCRALAPADWQIVNVSQNSNAVDLFNGTFGASWMVSGVPGEVMSVYPQYASPEAFLYWATQALFQSVGETVQPQFSNAQPLGNGYVVRDFEGTKIHGVIIYISFPQQTGGFIVAARSAYGPKPMWQAYGPVAVAIATTIRCTVQLQSPYGGGGSTGGASREEETYNQQLGTEYAHDPETGENYLMNHATDYMNGPQGPGYYKPVGNGYRKLEPGRSQ